MRKYNTLSNVKYALCKIYKYNNKIIWFILVYTLSSTILTIINLYIPKFIIDELTNDNRISQLCIYLVIFLISGVLLTYIINYLKNITLRDFHEFRCLCLQDYQKRCFDLEMKDIEDPSFLNKVGMARSCLYDNNKGFEGTLRKLFTLLGYVFSFLYFTLMIAMFQPFILILLLLNTILPYILSSKLKIFEYSKQNELIFENRKLEYVNNVMSDFSYGKEIRIFKMSDWLISIANNINIKLLRINKAILNKQSLTMIVNILINLLREGVVYGYLVYCVLNKNLSLGDFTLYMGMIFSFSSLLSNMIDDVNHIRAQSLLINDYREFMEFDIDDVSTTKMEICKGQGCCIDFVNVSFAYPGSKTYIFDNLSIHIDNLEKVAIVGTNGSGKTTFIKLVCGFYKPDKGQVLINNVDISNYDHDSIFKILSVLFQDISFFSMSIAENITFQNNHLINYEKLHRSINTASFREKIDELEKGVDTTLKKILDTDGIELSGGENQKLAMTRSIYKDGNLFILDEPTSALDPIAENEIYNRFNEITENKTCLFVTHRLASTKFCDRILVFQDGSIVEIGTHDELLNLGGVYKEIFELQSSYYSKEG